MKTNEQLAGEIVEQLENNFNSFARIQDRRERNAQIILAALEEKDNPTCPNPYCVDGEVRDDQNRLGVCAVCGGTGKVGRVKPGDRK